MTGTRVATSDDKAADEQGFTLIELLVVIVILGILAAVAIPTYLAQRDKANAADSISNLRNVAVVAETYFIDAASYAGLSTSTLFTEYDTAGDDINLTVIVEEDAGYCIEATNARIPGRVFRADNRGGQTIIEDVCVP